MNPARTIVSEVAAAAPDVYREILATIRPHRIESVERLLNKHLKAVSLDVFNRHRKRLPTFLLAFVRAIRKNFPAPGTAFGILLTCRNTKADTQQTLDSKHLGGRDEDPLEYNVVKNLKYELEIFTTRTQALELATRRKYGTVFATGYTIPQLMSRIPDSCRLERGWPFNKGMDSNGRLKYLCTFRFVLVQHVPGVVKILYGSSRSLHHLLQRLDPARVVALSDLRHVYAKCGIVGYFFNMQAVFKLQLFRGVEEDGVNEHDLLTINKYQCRSGVPLPMNRDGLAKNADRSPIDVLSFEAPKRNYVRLTTTGDRRRYPVETSADKIFFGQQFNEGTGYNFALMPGTSKG